MSSLPICANRFPVQLEPYLTGTLAFIIYWLVLMAVALAELVWPAKPRGSEASGRVGTNFAFGLIGFAIVSIPILAPVSAAIWAADRGYGMLNQIDLPEWLEIAASFLLADFLLYLFHQLSHRIPFLWRFHRVHHNDPRLDLSTYFRSHPLAISLIALFGFCNIALLGLHPIGLALHGIARLIVMSLGHANIDFGTRRWTRLEQIIVTPSFHRNHHSARRDQTDSNYGEVLTLWDHWLGTATPTDEPVARFGLGDAHDSDAGNMASQLREPFRQR